MKIPDKSKIIATICVIAVLVIAYFSSGTARERTASPGQTSLPVYTTLRPTAATEAIIDTEQVLSTPSPEPSESPTPEPSESTTSEPSESPIPTLAASPTPTAAPADVPDEPVISAEPQTDSVKSLTCKLSVRCDTVLNNLDKLAPEKHSLIPENGIIFAKDVAFEEGESVFDLLKRTLMENKIHFEYETAPGYNSVYIEGIANLYEFDCGELSGWMYRVNGEFADCGSSEYLLKNGDIVEWVYSCDMGLDVGDDFQ